MGNNRDGIDEIEEEEENERKKRQRSCLYMIVFTMVIQIIQDVIMMVQSA